MIRKKLPKQEIIIDLDGPDGNGIRIIGVIKRMIECRHDITHKIPAHIFMKDTKYEELLAILNYLSWGLIVLETDNEELIKTVSKIDGKEAYNKMVANLVTEKIST